MTQISAEVLAARLKQGKAPAAVLLYGPDAFLRESCREQIIEAVVDPAARQWAVEHYSGAENDLEEVIGRARMMPMLAARQVIVYSELEEIEPAAEPKSKTDDEDSGKEDGPARSKSKKSDVTEILREYLESPAPFTVLVLEAAELDKRTKLAKLLLEEVPVVAAELPEDAGERLRIATQMAKRMAAQDSGAIEDDAAEELADLCNCDLAAIRAEIGKLVTYAGTGSKGHARGHRSAGGRGEEVFRLGACRCAGEWPTGARAHVSGQAAARRANSRRRWWARWPGRFASCWKRRNSGAGLRRGWRHGRLGMRRDAADMALRQAQKISRAQLVRGLRALYEADNRLKSGTKDDRAVMEFLVAQLAGGRAAAARSA